jgi:pyrimidine-nucleoside phosphorylase
MDMPLGNAVGNSLEVMEAIDTLKGKGPEDLKRLSVELAARMLEGAGKGNYDECLEMAEKSIWDGSALNKFAELIKRQNGNSEVIDNYSVFGVSKNVFEYKASCDGFIESIKTDSLGVVSMILGAGRENKESKIDYTAGIELQKKTYDKVKKGDVVARLYTNNKESIDKAVHILNGSITFSDDKPLIRPLILAYMDSAGVNMFI